MRVHELPIQHTNRRGKTFFLHQDLTKTGKPRYFFSAKQEVSLVETVPEGFEIYENPAAQVFLRKIQPQIITEEETAVVERRMMRRFPPECFRIEVKKHMIIVFFVDQDVGFLSGLLGPARKGDFTSRRSRLEQMLSYSPMLRFVLADETKRTFLPERYCFRGSIDDWISIGEAGALFDLVERYAKHLDRDSFYELF